MKFYLFFSISCLLLVSTEARRHRHHHRQKINTKPSPAYHHQPDLNPNDPEDHWDFLLLVLNWPQSKCMYTTRQACEIPSEVSGWVLHGLWPSRKINTKRHGPYTCTDIKFNATKIEDLKNDLSENWPNLFPGKPQEDFWKHEFEKHGTCAAALPTFFATEHQFFNETLALKKQFDLTRFLEADKIKPSDEATYKGEDVKKAINTGLGAKGCVKGRKHKGKLLIDEVRICLDKQLQPFDCSDDYCKSQVSDEDNLHYDTIHHMQNRVEQF